MSAIDNYIKTLDIEEKQTYISNIGAIYSITTDKKIEVYCYKCIQQHVFDNNLEEFDIDSIKCNH